MKDQYIIVKMVVEAQSAQEAQRIVEERAKLKWPPVKHLKVEIDRGRSDPLASVDI